MEKCAEETDGNCTLPALKLGATMRALGENISDRDAMRLALQSSIIDSRGTLSWLLVCVCARVVSACVMCACECVLKRVCAHTLVSTVLLLVCTRLCSCPHVLFFQISMRIGSHACNYPNHTGHVHFSSFVGLLAHHVEGRETEEDLKRAFSYLDTQQKGVVSVSDIQRGLALMGVRMTETDVVSAHLCVCVESACVDKICLMKHGQREN